MFKCSQKSYLFVNIVLSIILFLTSFIFPFENCFFSFNSIENLCNYINFPYNTTSFLIEGKETDFIVTNDFDTTKYLILPKENNRWKLPNKSQKLLINQKRINDVLVYLYKYTKSDDYYIRVIDIKGNSLTISDSRQSRVFENIQTNTATQKEFITYYVYVHNLDSNYFLLINGKRISFESKIGNCTVS